LDEELLLLLPRIRRAGQTIGRQSMFARDKQARQDKHFLTKRFSKRMRNTSVEGAEVQSKLAKLNEFRAFNCFSPIAHVAHLGARLSNSSKRMTAGDEDGEERARRKSSLTADSLDPMYFDKSSGPCKEKKGAESTVMSR